MEAPSAFFKILPASVLIGKLFEEVEKVVIFTHFFTDLYIKLRKNGELTKCPTINILGYFYLDNYQIRGKPKLHKVLRMSANMTFGVETPTHRPKYRLWLGLYIITKNNFDLQKYCADSVWSGRASTYRH